MAPYQAKHAACTMINTLKSIDCENQGEHLEDQPQGIAKARADQASHGQESRKAK